MEVSENIKRVREAKGLKQADIAKAIGMERTNYHRIENRGSKLTIEQLEAIAGALGVTVIELLTSEEKPIQNDERVRELEKRVEELEDRIKDKEIINKQLEEQYKKIKRDLFEWFYHDYYLQAAIKYEIGRVELYDVASEKTLASFSLKEMYLESEIWKQAEKDNYSRIDYRYKFTNEEEKQVANLLFSDLEFRNHAIGFTINKFIDSEVIRNAYQNFRNKIRYKPN